MVTRRQAGVGLLSAAAVAGAPGLAAQESATMTLPPPRLEGGRPLMQALQLRRSTREYASRPLPREALSDLLWAAFGINRPATGDRTAPYWRHVMVIDVYAAMADGVWLYEPQAHALVRHSPEDIRAQTGLQDFVATAPLNLIYVAHGERMQDIHQRSGGSMPRSTRASSGRTSTSTARRRDLRPSFAVRWTPRRWPRGCNWVPASSSPLRSPSAIRGREHLRLLCDRGEGRAEKLVFVPRREGQVVPPPSDGGFARA
jgi:hypothetical protein